MSPDEILEARLRLSMAPGLGPILTGRLERELGGPVAVCSATAQRMSRVEGIGLKKADMIRRGIDEADIGAERQLVERSGVRLVGIDDDEYPSLLRHIPDPPMLLYVRGSLERADAVALAVVGARQCTIYGREQADRLAGLCSQAGLTIVSGGARGIDTAAHRAALRAGGRTIAVLGCGLAHTYPEENGPLFDEIAAGRGAVISEMPMRSPPIAENFPRRNRIISGLSLGVLVVEASARSGALITARLATEEHHREVMALPGRVDSVASTGCHKILREGWATLVTGPADILDCLGEAGQTLKAALQPESGQGPSAELFNQPNLTGDAAKVYDAITTEPLFVDVVCQTTGLGVGTIQAALMQLQLTGLIDRLPGNRVKRRK